MAEDREGKRLRQVLDETDVGIIEELNEGRQAIATTYIPYTTIPIYARAQSGGAGPARGGERSRIEAETTFRWVRAAAGRPRRCACSRGSRCRPREGPDSAKLSVVTPPDRRLPEGSSQRQAWFSWDERWSYLLPA